LLTGISVNSLAVSGDSLVVGTSDGVFLFAENDTGWAAVNSGLRNKYVRSLAASGTHLFAGTSSEGVFLSTNDNTSWTEVNSGLLPNTHVNAFAVIDAYIFAGTGGGSSGVWRRPLLEMVPVELTSFTATANAKEVTLNWSTATALNNQGFEVQRKFGLNDFATVGSVRGHGTTTSPIHYTYVDKLIDEGKYFYRLKQIDFNGTFEYSNEIEVDVRVLDKFTLEQNYPNPFNPTTTIGFGIMKKGNVKLSIHNILGEEIRVLLNGEKEAGYHSIDFNGSDLPSGVYFYRIQAGSYIAMNKMILLK